MCHDFIISAQRQSTGKKGVNTWWWPPFVLLIVSAALFLSSLVTSATGFAPMARPRKNATYCAKSIWPGWLLLFFGAFFHDVSRGGRSTPVPPRRRLVTTNLYAPLTLSAFFFTLFITNKSILQRRKHTGFLYRNYKFHGTVEGLRNCDATTWLVRTNRVLRDSKWKMLIYRRYLQSYTPCYKATD